MVEIQELFIILILVLGVIGMVRGFLKELGVTLVLIATLFALDRLIPIFNGFINSRRPGLPGAGARSANAKHGQSVVSGVFGDDDRGDVHCLSGRDAGL